MRYHGIPITFAVLIAAVVPNVFVPNLAQAADAMANLTWIVVERCGENAAAENAELRKGFDRQTQLTTENSHIVGHAHTVCKRDSSAATRPISRSRSERAR
jgi:hypothetical protein